MLLQENRLLIIVQSLSDVHSAIPWNTAHQASLSFTVSWSLIKLMSLESVMPSNHLILCHPLLFLPSMFPSIRVFSFLFKFYFIFKLYIIVLVLPNIKMNPPQVFKWFVVVHENQSKRWYLFLSSRKRGSDIMMNFHNRAIVALHWMHPS